MELDQGFAMRRQPSIARTTDGRAVGRPEHAARREIDVSIVIDGLVEPS